MSKSKRVRFPRLSAMLFSTLLVVGCSAPFTADILARAEDTTPPVITIVSPASESYYSKTVVVSGSVTDATDSSDVAGSIASLIYEIPAASIAVTVPVGSDGTFQFQFSTAAFTGGTISFQVIATDGNGNEAVESVSLLYAGSDIASFEVIPGNQQVTLRWDAVPDAGGYTVRNVGESLEVEIAASAASYTWTGLTNGALYYFQLEAVDASAQSNLSAEMPAIPLSAYTLLPTIDPYDDHVHISWRAMAGISDYVVERADDIDGPYSRRFVTSEAEVDDYQLSRNTFYYYRVYPEDQDSVRSAPAEAILVPFTVTGTEEAGYYGPLTGNSLVVARGNYLFTKREDSLGKRWIDVLDVSDPADPTSVAGVTDLTGGGTDEVIAMVIDEVEDLLYLSIEELGLVAIDISNPEDPYLLTPSGTSDKYIGGSEDQTFNDLAVVRGALYSYVIAIRSSGDVYSGRVERSGDEITFTGAGATTTSTGSAGGLSIVGSTAYVSVENGGAGFVTIDVSNPESLPSATAGVITSGSYAEGPILATDDYVFYAFSLWGGGSYYTIAVERSGYSQLAVYDFSGRVLDLFASDGMLYVCAGTAGVLGFDISEPPSSDSVNAVVAPDLAGWAQEATVVGDYLIVAANTGLETFEILSRIESAPERTYIGGATTYSSMVDMTSVGFSSHWISNHYFWTADLSDLASLSSLDSASGLEGGAQLILQGDRELLVANGDVVYSTSMPGSPELTQTVGFSHEASSFVSVGDYSYGLRGGVLSVFDTSDLEAVTQFKTIAFEYNILDAAVRGDYLYLAYVLSGYVGGGFIVVDISDPTGPDEVGRVSTPDYAVLHDIELHGDLIYAAYADNNNTYHVGSDDESGLMIYSLADDPETPSLIATYVGEDVFSNDPTGWNWVKRFERLDVSGHLVALSSGLSANSTGNDSVYKGRIVLLDVHDPENITLVKNILPDGGDTVGTGYEADADFPSRIRLWNGRVIFVMGRQGLSYYEL